MEKLIELLNEYMEYKEKFGPDKLTRFKGVDTSGNLLFELKNGEYFQEEYIISKKFGFIKWLVDNDKIDLLRLDNRIALSEFNKVERVLMALSISSSPIEDLVSYLR